MGEGHDLRLPIDAPHRWVASDACEDLLASVGPHGEMPFVRQCAQLAIRQPARQHARDRRRRCRVALAMPDLHRSPGVLQQAEDTRRQEHTPRPSCSETLRVLQPSCQFFSLEDKDLFHALAEHAGDPHGENERGNIPPRFERDYGLASDAHPMGEFLLRHFVAVESQSADHVGELCFAARVTPPSGRARARSPPRRRT